jgi:hypothetical protein
MTNLDALKAVVDVDLISDNSLLKALVDADIDPTDDYSAGHKDAMDAAGVEVLKGFLLTSMSEGGYSVSFDRKAIESKIALLSGTGIRGVQRITI